MSTKTIQNKLNNFTNLRKEKPTIVNSLSSRIFSLTIKSKIMILLLISSILPMSVIVIVQLMIEENTMTEHTLNEMRTISRDRYSNIHRIWQLRMEQVAVLSNNSVLKEFITSFNDQKRVGTAAYVDDLERELQYFTKSTGDVHGFLGFLILDENNNVIYRNSNKIDYGAYLKHETLDFAVIENPVVPYSASLIIGAPIYDDEYRIIGSVFAERDIIFAQEILQDRSYLGQTGESYLVNHNKRMITESRFISDAEFNQVVDTLPVRKCFEEGKSVGGKWTDYRGVWVFGSSICDKENDLVLIAEQDVSEALSSLDLLRANAIVALFITSCILVLISIFLSKKISEPLKKLIDATTKIRDGNYDVRVAINSRDEVGILGRHFNIMGEKISYMTNNLQQLVDMKTNHLEEANKKLQATSLENLNIRQALDESSIVAITDADGNITHVNKKFCDISKYTRDELIGKNHRVLKSGFHSPQFYQKMWLTISSGNIWQGVIKNKAKDGTFYWVQTTIVPFLNDKGAITQYISIRTDVTKQIALQEEKLTRERLTAIGELAARLAHDIRNPLATIRTAVAVMRKMQTFGKHIDESNFERIERAIFRISHQIDDVLNFIRKSPLKIEQITSNELIESVLEKIQIPDSIIIRKPEANIEMECDIIKIDALLTNLIINAIQAIEKNGTVSIRIFDDKDTNIIEVEDSGHGIPDNILNRIFEPLFTTKQAGTGLGLSSCKSIVDAHHGTITVKNNPTTFTVTLPKYFTTE